MSRIGKMPVPIAKGVEVKQAAGMLSVKGPKGQLELTFHPDMTFVVDEAELRVERPSDQKEHRALHGLTRSLIANMVMGVTEASPRRWKSSASGTGPTSRGRASRSMSGSVIRSTISRSKA